MSSSVHQEQDAVMQEIVSERSRAATAEPDISTQAPETTVSTKPISTLNFNDADTLVYVDPPPETLPIHASMAPPKTSVPHRMHSEAIRNTGSPELIKLLEPTHQYRALRQRRLVSRLPVGIKYVVDLSPPAVEDEAVRFIMELSCPLGVRSWASKKRRWGLPQSCVGGKDDIDPRDCSASAQAQDTQSTAEKQERQSEPKTTRVTRSMVSSMGQPYLPVEYSSFRHRAGIERLLHALEGLPVELNTPCKMWTFFALANLFDIAAVPRISVPILAWCFELTNSKFIELNPEVTYRVACGTESRSLCRFTFSILVGEEAMLSLANVGEPARLNRPSRTHHGRIRDELNDTELQRVEYASRSFVDHVVGHFTHLAGTEMSWLEEVEEYKRLLRFRCEHPEKKDLANGLIAVIKNWARGYIYAALYRSQRTWTQTQWPSPTDKEDYPPEEYDRSYGGLRRLERLMSRTFWKDLMVESFEGDWSVRMSTAWQNKHLSIADIGDLPALKENREAKLEYNQSAYLAVQFTEFNNIVRQTPNFTWPVDVPSGNQHDANHMTTLRVAEQQDQPTRIPDPWEEDPWKLKSADDEDYISLSDLRTQIRSYMFRYARELAEPADGEMIPELTDTLTSLTENEFKYLPLWAGGNDDGTGGVFLDHEIPMVDVGGFSAPGPVIHTGSAAPSEDSFAMLDQSDIASTVQAASHHATESHQTEVLSMVSNLDTVQTGVGLIDLNDAGMDWQDGGADGIMEDDGEGGNTYGDRDSISDFLTDDDELELDLDSTDDSETDL